MIAEWPVGLTLIAGGLLAAVARGRLRDAISLAAPLATLAQLVVLGHGDFARVHALGYTLVLMHVDRLSLLFGYVFAIAALLNAIYGLHVKDGVAARGGADLRRQRGRRGLRWRSCLRCSRSGSCPRSRRCC